MNIEWQAARLDELTDTDSPITYGVVKPGDPGDVLFIRGGDLADGRVLSNQLRTITRAVSEQYSRTLLRGGELLMCLVGQPGQVAVAPPALAGANIARQVGLIRLRAEIDAEFIRYFLQSPDGQASLGTHTGGSVQQVINLGDLRTVNVPVPPLPEQRRIVGILDEAFAGIATAKANAEKNLQNARALFESHLQAVLRNKKWKWTTLGDLCNGVEYGSSAKSKKEGKVPVLRMGNIQEGELDWENLVYTDDKNEIEKYVLKHNDVLFNRTNSPELVGKAAIYKSEMPAIFAGYLIRIHRKEDLLDGDFLNYFLNSQIAFDYGKTVVISSVNQANINGAKLKGYPIPAPSLSEQKTIVKKLDDLCEEIQRLESLYQRKLAALDELKKSLLQRAFSGQL